MVPDDDDEDDERPRRRRRTDAADRAAEGDDEMAWEVRALRTNSARDTTSSRVLDPGGIRAGLVCSESPNDCHPSRSSTGL